MQETICAKVNMRLLTKADRLFTGTTEGRVIEILQNARRAGSTEVRISNKNGFVTVEDNGCGIEDFQKLLDLGGSGWDEKLEAGEDPAGVGVFSLAPREVTIISGDRRIVIDRGGWTGKPVAVAKIAQQVKGTIVKFKDEEPWDMELVEKYAVFAGIRVIVDGKYCQSMPFCSSKSVYYKKPGCRIEATEKISKYHNEWTCGWHDGRVIVNFHGQVVRLDYWPAKNRPFVTILVDIADQTDIRLMLPARTMLVENAAFEMLKNAIELEYYKYYQRQKKHTLYYQEYLRARELGIELPQAEPQFRVGLLCGDTVEPAEISPPKSFRLEDGYLCFNNDLDNDMAETNSHLLAALGEFKGKPFVPVTIDEGYMGYSWSKLPKVTKVEVIKVKEILRRSISCGEIACFDKLSITVHTSDGKIFTSEVDMAVTEEQQQDGKQRWVDETVCVTKKARDSLYPENIWFHLGGYNDEGDCYETQEDDFERELQGFWNELVGPYETLRQRLIKELEPIDDKWQKVTIFGDNSLEIIFKNGKRQRIYPPVEPA